MHVSFVITEIFQDFYTIQNKNIACCHYLVTKSCLILWDPMVCVACQTPLSMGFSQARILEWVQFSCPGVEPMSPALTGRFFTAESPGKPNAYAHIEKILI